MNPDLEEVWRLREEAVYPSVFGPPSRGIFPLDQAVFERFGKVNVDPRWLFHGVLEHAPTDERDSWDYVTSGYCNPWEDEPGDYDPTDKSGSGVEFLLETEAQGDWAVRLLRNMLAFDRMLTTRQVGAGQPLGFHDRIPIREPLDGQRTTTFRSVITVQPKCCPAVLSLPSGTFELMHSWGSPKQCTRSRVNTVLRRCWSG